MAGQHESPFFTVIIPTRNRADDFKIALDSVLNQSLTGVEVIVVNDGSVGEQLRKYKALEQDYSGVCFNDLPHRPNGHGQSYAMNYGAAKAKGKYICFLDDDDYWTDKEHLMRAREALSCGAPVDLYYTNQTAFFSDGSENGAHVWLSYLNERLDTYSSDDTGSYRVDTAFLLTSPGFAHLNCSIFRHKFFEMIGGLDENIRYENDRDVYIRSIDSAESILFNPAYVSRHHIPDQKNSSNMSTIVSANQKRLLQLHIYEKGVLFSKKAIIRDFCMANKGYTLKFIAQDFHSVRNFRLASWYARQALAALPSVKWRLYTGYLVLRSIFTRR